MMQFILFSLMNCKDIFNIDKSPTNPFFLLYDFTTIFSPKYGRDGEGFSGISMYIFLFFFAINLTNSTKKEIDAT